MISLPRQHYGAGGDCHDRPFPRHVCHELKLSAGNRDNANAAQGTGFCPHKCNRAAGKHGLALRHILGEENKVDCCTNYYQVEKGMKRAYIWYSYSHCIMLWEANLHNSDR
jgi:hypothetical protein